MQQLQDRICRCGRSPREAQPDMRWKIIFWIMFLIWSNTPAPGVCLRAMILSASLLSAFVCFVSAPATPLGRPSEAAWNSRS